MKKKKSIEAKDFIAKIVKIAQERHCENVVALDLKGKSPATDYFLIATGTSNRQMQTMADEIADIAKENGYFRLGIAGYEHGSWILLDYVDVMIHIMSEESREYYNLEMLWGDAEKLKIE